MLFTMTKCDQLHGPLVDDIRCPKCGRCDFHLQGRVKYLVLELFELPLFMLKRRFELQCDCGHCQSPSGNREKIKQLSRKMLPLTYVLSKHLGIFLLMLIIGYQWQTYQKQQSHTHSLLTSPQVNDFYFVDYRRLNPDSHPKYRYTAMKVIEVNDQTVTFRKSTLSSSRQVPARAHIKADRAMINGYFSKVTVTLKHSELLPLYNQEVIYEVRRPHKLKIDGWIVMSPPKPEAFVYRFNQDNQTGIAMFRGESGYVQDYKGAFEAFKKAAEEGDRSGQNNLGEMYRDGYGTEANSEKALYWFKLSAEQGLPSAQVNYRELCAKTLGCGSL